MRKALYAFVSGVAIVSVSMVGPSAQSRPDFSGKWTLVAGPDVIVGGPLGREGVISQDATSVTFTQSLPVTHDPNRSLTYRVDGSESRNETRTLRGETWTHLSQARWMSEALLVTTITNAGITGRWESVLTCSLDGKGNLVIVSVDPNLWPPSTMSTRTLTYSKN
jgi:hypothetical protein